MLVVPVASWAVVISRTRNAWLGAIVGLGVVAVLRAPKLLWGLAAAVVALLVLRPAPVVGRLTVVDASSVDRYYMWQAGHRHDPRQAGLRTGAGADPRRLSGIPLAGRAQRAAAAPARQRAADRRRARAALPRLVALVGGGGHGRRLARGRAAARDGRRWPRSRFLAAFMVAGLFEYNFGDSEILMFTLLVSALPYALRRERADAAA